MSGTTRAWRLALSGMLVVLVAVAGCARGSSSGGTGRPASGQAAEATAAPAGQAPAGQAPAAQAPAGQAPAAEAPVAQGAPQGGGAADDTAVANFYRGKVLRLIVGLPPGGGYDAYARQIARFLGQYIPGSPTVIVENMAGASSMVAANHVYNVAPKDGTVLLHYQGTIVPQQLFGAKGIEFDAAKFQHIGAPAHDTMALFVDKRAAPASFDQLLEPGRPELVIGGTAPGALTDDAPKLLRDVLGARLKLVSGYPGTAPIRLAMDAGEVDGLFNAWESIKITNFGEVQNGDWKVLVQLTEQPRADLPGVPSVADIARTDEQRQLLHYGAVVPSLFTRPFAFAPGVPPERVRAVRAAFEQVMHDPEFLSSAEQTRLTVEPINGEELQRLMEDYLRVPDNIRTRLRGMLVIS